jgi:hypothetical protein
MFAAIPPRPLRASIAERFSAEGGDKSSNS